MVASLKNVAVMAVIKRKLARRWFSGRGSARRSARKTTEDTATQDTARHGGVQQGARKTSRRQPKAAAQRTSASAKADEGANLAEGVEGDKSGKEDDDEEEPHRRGTYAMSTGRNRFLNVVRGEVTQRAL